MSLQIIRRTGPWFLIAFVVVLLIAVPGALACDNVTNVEGVYKCSGECIVTGSNGEKSVVPVTGERDTITRFPGASTELYQTHIVGEGGAFHELEIGALVGRTLRAATNEVTDRQYPVLEEYIFETDKVCKATGFQKVVRNPEPGNFKVCLIQCLK